MIGLADGDPAGCPPYAVFGNNCLFREVLDSFGIRNAREGEMTFWAVPPWGLTVWRRFVMWTCQPIT